VIRSMCHGYISTDVSVTFCVVRSIGPRSFTVYGPRINVGCLQHFDSPIFFVAVCLSSEGFEGGRPTCFSTLMLAAV